jgi:UDP-N-acetylmuramoylalanine--D-glutamate ligase
MIQSARSIVVGLGRTGLSCARYLHSRHENFAVTDSRAAPPESAALQKLAPEAEMRFGAFDESLLDDAMRVIASPGVSPREPFMMSAAIRGVPIIGDIELFAREAQAPVAAITGTNGKSTVTTLVARMAEAAGKRVLAGGNLGRPALDLLLDEAAPELYVLELSSFQLDTTRSLRTAAAVVLNVTPDHRDRYDSVGEYASSKARIFQHCDAAVINVDDPLVKAMTHRAARMLTFSLHADRGADYYARPHPNPPPHAGEGREGADVALMHGEEQLLLLSEMKIAGLHNVANALAALAMCDALQLPQEPCIAALREFSGLPHRSQSIAFVG